MHICFRALSMFASGTVLGTCRRYISFSCTVIVTKHLVWRWVRLPAPHHWEWQKTTKMEVGVWECYWPTLSLGDINTETWFSRLGVRRKADDLAL
jgi:hypothetical protein